MNNYLVVNDVLSKHECDVLSSAFTHDAEGINPCGDAQVPEAPAIYNYLPFVRLLIRLTPVVSEITGISLLPTYAHARHYNKSGIELVKHKDRAACEITMSLNLKTTIPWAIHVNDNGSDVPIFLPVGSGIIYRGQEVEHWREPYAGDDHVNVFLHWVDGYGENVNHYFDSMCRGDNYEA